MKILFPILITEDVEKHPERFNQNWALGRIRRSLIPELHRIAWMNLLRGKRVILIDTPDYSKTDRRAMVKDLDEVYSLWDSISRAFSQATIVIAIQKELFGGHFFFDKMEKVELEPLAAKELVEAYRKRFGSIEPFTEDGLFTLARMSRGIFRRFLRYITLTLSLWEIKGKGPIDVVIVKEAVPVARLVEDMELELVELFPKQSDLRLHAVRLLMLLEESEPRRQNELGEMLGMEAYQMTRLLEKLELHHYVDRQREGNDKLVSLHKNA